MNTHFGYDGEFGGVEGGAVEVTAEGKAVADVVSEVARGERVVGIVDVHFVSAELIGVSVIIIMEREDHP